MAACRNCIWLREKAVSDQCSVVYCNRPDRTGNLKSHKDVEGCDQYKEREV